jgi:hypothetical protein
MSRSSVLVAVIAVTMTLAGPAVALEPDLEEGFVRLINLERAGEGLAPLEMLDDLVDGARGQAERMAESGELFHNPDLAAVTDGWAALGENVGIGYSVESLHSAFMNSEAHRHNVLGAYDHLGVGVVTEGGMIHVAVVFADMVDDAGAEGENTSDQAGASGDVGNPFVDDDGSVHEPSIEVLAAHGITSGCAEWRFCPDDAVTRGQMAALLGRALPLEPVSADSFVDDDGSIFEPSIEALAAAGITRGCGPARFCPDQVVTRGQMAAFLSRALTLPAAPGDRFTDDDDSEFEAAVEALAAAGITKGCGPDRFCPDQPVTRAEMATFLARALGLKAFT